MAAANALSDLLVTAPDRYLTCRRCGVRFVWTGWEQRQEEAEPGHCPGCRHLLALTARQRATVKWYDRRKGFGFVTTSEGAEVFVHRRSLKGVSALRRGQVVTVRVETGEQGPQTVEVEPVGAAADDAGADSAEAGGGA